MTEQVTPYLKKAATTNNRHVGESCPVWIQGFTPAQNIAPRNPKTLIRK